MSHQPGKEQCGRTLTATSTPSGLARALAGSAFGFASLALHPRLEKAPSTLQPRAPPAVTRRAETPTAARGEAAAASRTGSRAKTREGAHIELMLRTYDKWLKAYDV